MIGPTSVSRLFPVYTPHSNSAYIYSESLQSLGSLIQDSKRMRFNPRLLTLCFPHLMLVYFQPLTHYGIHIKTQMPSLTIHVHFAQNF